MTVKTIPAILCLYCRHCEGLREVTPNANSCQTFLAYRCKYTEGNFQHWLCTRCDMFEVGERDGE